MMLLKSWLDCKYFYLLDTGPLSTLTCWIFVHYHLMGAIFQSSRPTTGGAAPTPAATKARFHTAKLQTKTGATLDDQIAPLS